MRSDLVDLRLFLHIADASRMVQEGPTSRLLPRASASAAWRKCSALHFSFVTAAEFSYHLLANVSWSTRVSSCSKRSACGTISPATPGGCRAQSACYQYDSHRRELAPLAYGRDLRRADPRQWKVAARDFAFALRGLPRVGGCLRQTSNHKPACGHPQARPRPRPSV